MNRLDLDWAYIRRHTLRPALCAVVAIGALAAAFWQLDEQQRVYSELHAAHDIVDRDYEALIRQRRLVERYHRHYQRFHELGFIGRESRLDWVETLRTTSESLSLPRLSYSIDPQLGVIAPVTSMLGGRNVEVRVSQLILDMGLVHEIDLLRFFDELQRKAPGLIKVDRCSLVFVAEGRLAATENLAASCAVQIFSVITSDVGVDAV